MELYITMPKNKLKRFHGFISMADCAVVENLAELSQVQTLWNDCPWKKNSFALECLAHGEPVYCRKGEQFNTLSVINNIENILQEGAILWEP